MEKMINIIKELNITQLVLYIILMIIDVYVLGIVDFIEHKLYGVLFVVVNACLIFIIRCCQKNKK